MDQHHLILLFLQLCAMLAVALVFGQSARRLHFPAVLGELGGGIMLGPTVFGALWPGAYAWIFPPDDLAAAGRESIIKNCKNYLSVIKYTKSSPGSNPCQRSIIKCQISSLQSLISDNP